jgi:hypothetical protein
MAGTAKQARGANGEGGVRQRPSGRWEARAAIFDAAGRLHRRSVTADTERDAKRRLRELVPDVTDELLHSALYRASRRVMRSTASVLRLARPYPVDGATTNSGPERLAVRVRE